MNLVEVLFKYSRTPAIGKVCYLFLKVLGLEIPRSVRVGEKLKLPHWAYGVVVHPHTILGSNVVIYQGVTIGRADVHEASAAMGGRVEVGDGVILGAGAKVLFRSGQTLIIGKNAVIGANSVLLQNVDANEIWSGVPAKFIKKREGVEQ